MPKRSWSEEDETELRKLASKGLSATAIGVKLKKTRGAIVGWCSRNGVTLTGRIKSLIPGPEPQALPKSRTGSFGRTRAKELRQIAEAPEAVIVREEVKKPTWPRYPTENSVHIMVAKEEHCRMPLWNSMYRTGLVCGEPTSGGKPYCKGCSLIVYQPRPVR